VLQKEHENFKKRKRPYTIYYKPFLAEHYILLSLNNQTRLVLAKGNESPLTNTNI